MSSPKDLSAPQGEPGHFLFVVAAEVARRPGVKQMQVARRAREVILHRAKTTLWPLGGHLKFARAFRPGDNVLFYAAGEREPDRSCFIGTSRIAGQIVSEERPQSVQQESAYSWRSGRSFVPIDNVKLFTTPIPIQSVVEELSFIANKKHWGGQLAPAFHRIPRDDFQLVLEKAKVLRRTEGA